MTPAELIAELEWVREEAQGNLACVIGDRCVGDAEHEAAYAEMERMKAAINAAIQVIREDDERGPCSVCGGMV